MAFSLNKVFLVGNVTKEPELRYTPGGTAVLSLGMATNRSIKDESVQSGWRDVPTFHNVIVWGKLAERLSQNVSKGDKIHVEGRIDNRSYEKDGVKKYITEVVAENVLTFQPRPGRTEVVKEKAEEQPNDAPAEPEYQGDTPEEPAKKRGRPSKEDKEAEVNPDDIPF